MEKTDTTTKTQTLPPRHAQLHCRVTPEFAALLADLSAKSGLTRTEIIERGILDFAKKSATNQ